MKKRDLGFLMDVIAGGSAIVIVLSVVSYILFRSFSGHGFLAVCFLVALLGLFVFKKAFRLVGSALAGPFVRVLSFKNILKKKPSTPPKI